MFRTLRAALCAALCAALLALPAAASAASASEMTGGFGYGIVGPRTLQLGALSSHLTTAGFTPPSTYFLNLGGGGHLFRGRWVFGGEGYGLLGLGTPTQREGERASLSGAYGLFKVGYALVSTRHLMVYPLVGVGGGGMWLRFSGSGADTFAASADGEGGAGIGGMLLEGALAFDVLVPIPHGGAGRDSLLVLGLRAGYTMSPLMGCWQRGDVELKNGPDFGLFTGPSLRLVIGAGGRGHAG